MNFSFFFLLYNSKVVQYLFLDAYFFKYIARTRLCLYISKSKLKSNKKFEKLTKFLYIAQ